MFTKGDIHLISNKNPKLFDTSIVRILNCKRQIVQRWDKAMKTSGWRSLQSLQMPLLSFVLPASVQYLEISSSDLREKKFQFSYWKHNCNVYAMWVAIGMNAARLNDALEMKMKTKMQMKRKSPTLRGHYPSSLVPCESWFWAWALTEKRQAQSSSACGDTMCSFPWEQVILQHFSLGSDWVINHTHPVQIHSRIIHPQWRIIGL